MSVIVSFTSLPSRLPLIQPMLQSVLIQDPQPDKIILWLSTRAKREPDITMTLDKVPDCIRQLPIEIRFTEDYGPHTKLLPSILAFDDPETRIITVDDDTIYPQTWLHTLLQYSNLYPNSAIGPRGRILFRRHFKIPLSPYVVKRKLLYEKGKTIILSQSDSPKEVDILTGVWGTLYRRSFFSNDVFELNHCPEAFYNDDIWNSGYLAKKGIKRLCIPFSQTFADLPMQGINRLWDSVNNGRGLNNKTIQYFKNAWDI